MVQSVVDYFSGCFMKKKILVTGGAGFLGSHLCEKLLSKGCKVICLDNFHTGSKANVAHLFLNSDFEILEHDIIIPFFVEVDEIYNLACPASPIHYQSDPVRTIKTSFMGAVNMLDLAKKNGAKMLQASTSEVYGDPEVHPQTEDYRGKVNPIGVRSCYDEGKRAAECLMMDYRRQNKVNSKIVRIFNTYGPRMAVDDGRVVSNFIVKALRNEDITIFGDGSQTRSFCFVSDLIEGMVKMMDGPDEFFGPVNLGNKSEFSILDLASLVIKLTRSYSKAVYLPLPEDDPVQRKPDISLAENMLKWKPEIEPEQGLNLTINYYKDLVK